MIPVSSLRPKGGFEALMAWGAYLPIVRRPLPLYVGAPTGLTRGYEVERKRECCLAVSDLFWPTMRCKWLVMGKRYHKERAVPFGLERKVSDPSVYDCSPRTATWTGVSNATQRINPIFC